VGLEYSGEEEEEEESNVVGLDLHWTPVNGRTAIPMAAGMGMVVETGPNRSSSPDQVGF
jgi:hypothetical protein